MIKLLINNRSQFLFKIVNNESLKSLQNQRNLGCQFSQLRYKSTKSEQDDDDLDKPIKFSTSKASDWKAKNTFRGTIPEDQPWIQPYSVIFSTAAILLYFCVLREENDMDDLLGKTLWERIPGLEEKQLKVVYDYNKEHNIDNTAIVERMKVLKDQKAD